MSKTMFWLSAVVLLMLGCQTPQPKKTNNFLEEVSTGNTGWSGQTMPETATKFENLGGGWFVFTFEDKPTGKTHRILALKQHAHSTILCFTELK